MIYHTLPWHGLCSNSKHLTALIFLVYSGVDQEEGCRGCALPSPEMTCVFLFFGVAAAYLRSPVIIFSVCISVSQVWSPYSALRVHDDQRSFVSVRTSCSGRLVTKLIVIGFYIVKLVSLVGKIRT